MTAVRAVFGFISANFGASSNPGYKLGMSYDGFILTRMGVVRLTHRDCSALRLE